MMDIFNLKLRDMNYSNLKYTSLLILIAFITSLPLNAQVAIGKIGVDDGAIFQLESSSKGLMIPNVALSSNTDLTTISPTPVEGLMVYNTASSGSGNNRVSSGFYYWNGSEWKRLYNDGYTVQFMQNNFVKAINNTNTYTFPGLDQTIVAPNTGTYQIYVIGHYAANSQSGTTEAVGYAEVMLEIDNVKVASAFVTSSSKRTPGNFVALAQQTSIIHNVDLVEGQSYNFKVRGRQWFQRGMSTSGPLGGMPSGAGGVFGIQTGPYNGNTTPTGSGNNDAQRGVLTITLLSQF